MKVTERNFKTLDYMSDYTMWGWLSKSGEKKVKAVGKDMQEVFGATVVEFGDLPANDIQKSFYGRAKCIVTLTKAGSSAFYLLSYSTIVCLYTNGKFYKLWNEYSRTTMNHINAFRYMAGLENLSKNEWLDLPCYHYDYAERAFICE